MSHPIRDPEGTGKEWLYRGLPLNDQRDVPLLRASGNCWSVSHPDGIYGDAFRTKAQAYWDNAGHGAPDMLSASEVAGIAERGGILLDPA